MQFKSRTRSIICAIFLLFFAQCSAQEYSIGFKHFEFWLGNLVSLNKGYSGYTFNLNIERKDTFQNQSILANISAASVSPSFTQYDMYNVSASYQTSVGLAFLYRKYVSLGSATIFVEGGLACHYAEFYLNHPVRHYYGSYSVDDYSDGYIIGGILGVGANIKLFRSIIWEPFVQYGYNPKLERTAHIPVWLSGMGRVQADRTDAWILSVLSFKIQLN